MLIMGHGFWVILLTHVKIVMCVLRAFVGGLKYTVVSGIVRRYAQKSSAGLMKRRKGFF